MLQCCVGGFNIIFLLNAGAALFIVRIPSASHVECIVIAYLQDLLKDLLLGLIFGAR